MRSCWRGAGARNQRCAHNRQTSVYVAQACRARESEKEGGSMREREQAPTTATTTTTATALWNAGSNNLHLTVINLDVVPAIWLCRAKGAPAAAAAAAPARCDHTLLLLPLLCWEAVGKYVPQQQ